MTPMRDYLIRDIMLMITVQNDDDLFSSAIIDCEIHFVGFMSTESPSKLQYL